MKLKASPGVMLLLAWVAFPFSAIAQEWRPPTTLKRLPNGLTVVLSEDHSAPTVGLCISYAIGSRLEPGLVSSSTLSLSVSARVTVVSASRPGAGVTFARPKSRILA